MKRTLWLVNATVVVATLMVGGHPSAAYAQGDVPDRPMDRLERLERRVNEMAARQEKMMRRFEAQLDRQDQMARPERGAAPARLDRVAAPPAGRDAQRMAVLKSIKDMMGLFFLVYVMCNILLSIWIFTDIRKRGEGSGIFVALALVAGVPTAIIYSLVRIGDRKA